MKKSGNTPVLMPPASRYRRNALPARNNAGRYRCVDDPCLADHFVEFFDRWVTDGQFWVNNVVDRDLVSGGREIQLLSGPLSPPRVSRNEVQKDVTVDKDQSESSPRVRAMISSVVISSLALPSNRANLLSGALPRVFRNTRPSSVTSNSISEPGFRPRYSRILLGIVT